MGYASVRTLDPELLQAVEALTDLEECGAEAHSASRLGLAVALLQAAAARGSAHVREVAAKSLLPGALLALHSFGASPEARRAVCGAGQALLIACCAARCAMRALNIRMRHKNHADCCMVIVCIKAFMRGA